jgi:hypothetical protein
MPLTVLEIVQSALYEIGVKPPATLLSATDQTQLQLKHLLYAQSRQMRNRRVFPQQKKTHTFDLVNGVGSYQLPKDYFSGLLSTQWDDDRRMRLIGPLTDEEYTLRTKGLGSTSITPAYRIFGPDANPASAGGQFKVDPTPTSSGETLSYEYVSKNMFLPPNWQVSTAYVIGDYVNANGNIYICDTNGTSHASTAPTGTTTNITDGTTRWDYSDAAYETIRTNSDLSLFDDDCMVAGVKWRYLQAKGLDYETAYNSYAALVDKAVMRWSGPYKGTFDGAGLRKRYAAPDGSWSL